MIASSEADRKRRQTGGTISIGVPSEDRDLD
ncbi:hypothetical protein SFHH103_02997 [Sinorhizobium fredii HH103]|uniref:Uncharacterized protein n=1 Tax=Sinorhizobium fredii (strain HH103) TaxID=1117943 RepID=G9A1A9_SINF1|nr:hypothetical protein SFHH103_02997 [Sinorhizobium fredii HH103]